MFNIQGLMRHSRPTKRDLPITYHAFPHDVALCPVATLDSYINAREKLVNAALHDELLLCYRKPHGPPTNDTLARWVKTTLQYSGINLDTFTAHSCRSASTSKAATAGVSLQTCNIFIPITKKILWLQTDCWDHNLRLEL